jgi:hypothetical protein
MIVMMVSWVAGKLASPGVAAARSSSVQDLVATALPVHDMRYTAARRKLTAGGEEVVVDDRARWSIQSNERVTGPPRLTAGSSWHADPARGHGQTCRSL